MLLDNDTIKVIRLLEQFNELNNVDKLRLTTFILENKNFHTQYNLNDTINILKYALGTLDSKYKNTITNFSKYKNLLYYSTKYLELSVIEKKQFIVEILFNIYNTNFNDKINSLISNRLLVYEIYYNLF